MAISAKSVPALRAVVLDLDGVVYRGKSLLPGAKQAIAWLREQGLKVFFLTNNSTLTRADYVRRLEGYGIPCAKHEIFSSASACALYLQSCHRQIRRGEENGGANSRALVVGEGGLSGELRHAGIGVVRRLDGKKVQYVVVGMDRRITYKKLLDAQAAILQGAKFIASNADPVYPVEHGVIPGGGTIVAAIQAACGQKPLVIGKPSPYILKLLLRQENLKPSQALLVGDRLDTDIACGRRAGVPTVLVLTGVTTRAEVKKAPPRLQPDWVLESLGDLPALLANRKDAKGAKTDAKKP